MSHSRQQQPSVSILINNYNYCRFLNEAIQSALSQTYKAIEIVVVDDGSTDDSQTLIRSFGDQIKAIFKKNGGQGSAYNVGFAACSGNLIHFLDSDDKLEPNAIEEAVRLWEPGVAKVHFYLRAIEGMSGKPTRVLLPGSQLADGDVKKQIGERGSYVSPPASGNLFSRACLTRIFPMPEAQWVTAADTYPIFLAPLFGEVRACRKVLGMYRVHGANHDAQTITNGTLLRYRLQKENMREALFKEYFPIVGMTYIPGTVQNDLAHMKIRLASLVLEPAQHPYKSDRRIEIAQQILARCWRERSWPLKKKLLFSAWIGLLIALPPFMLQRTIDFGFIPSQRHRLLQNWTSGAKA